MDQLTAALLKRTKNGKKPLPKLRVAKPPVGIERQYLRDLLPYLKTIQKSVNEILLPRLPHLFAEFDKTRPNSMQRRDAATDDIITLIRDIGLQIEQSYTPEQIRILAARQGVSVAEYNKRIAQQNLKRVVGFDLFYAEPYLAGQISSFAFLNADLIGGIAQDSVSKVQRMTFEALASGQRWESLVDDIQKVIDPEDGTNRSRAEFIARDQVSKLNGQLTQVRQQDLGVKRYRWRTAGDDRVRDSHREKDGKIFSWDDPPADTGHPGEDYQCRCYAEPVLEDLVSGGITDWTPDE